MANLDPGDETRLNADYIGFDTADADVVEGDLVTLTGGTISKAAAGDQALGVAYTTPATDGVGGQDRVVVKTQGSVMAFVQSDTTAGTELGSPDTAATTPETGGSYGSADTQGAVSLGDAEAVEDSDGNSRYMAEVLIR